MAYKRILTVQDISCVGQCSMTVALPILSACGLETCVLPTALLSTHTAFPEPAVRHLADGMEPIRQHWQREGITFDAIYTGYLGSVEAVRAAGTLMDTVLAPGGMVIVDPAMADNGKRYRGLDEHYAEAMGLLCRRADVILPNLTEAAMLAGLPYRENPEEVEVRALLEKLGHPCVVLTGVGFAPEQTGVAVWEAGKLSHYSHCRIGSGCHGTGDIFASCFTGAMMQEKPIFQAARIAAEFTCRCIENTTESPAHWYGVKFETALPDLIRLLQA